MPQSQVRSRNGLKLPPELINIVGTSAALGAVVAIGSTIVAVLPDPTAWEFAAAYLAPGAVAFLAYWWIAQKL